MIQGIKQMKMSFHNVSVPILNLHQLQDEQYCDFDEKFLMKHVTFLFYYLSFGRSLCYSLRADWS